MNIFLYALMTYGLTAVISFAVIGIVVLVGKLMSKPEAEEEEAEDA